MTHFLRTFLLLVISICVCLSSAIHAAYDYHVVIDGGGSSSRLQVLDATGSVLQLQKTDEAATTELVRGCANISTLGQEGFTATLHALFDHLMVGDNLIPFESIIPHSTLTAGLAGVGCKKMHQKVEETFEDLGFAKDQINLYPDVGLALELVKDSGAVLICGTGSICFSKEQDSVFRSGGLGRVLGDEGSGYRIGLKAIQCSLEQEYDWGLDTVIYDNLREFFDCELLSSIIKSIHSGEITPKTIASLTPLVFDAAYNGDLVCSQILDQAAYDLGTIAAHALKNLKETHPIVYLVGGVFKNEHANSFIKKIATSPPIQALGKQPIFVNISEVNYATEVVLEGLLAKIDLDGLLNALPFVKGEFNTFSQTYRLGKLTTEMSNATTQMLSETFQKSTTDALDLLYQVDSNAAQGAYAFLQKHEASFSSALHKALTDGGRVFFIGSGSSGRVACDLEAKWNVWFDKDPLYKHKVHGLIAGGPRALIKSKEGFEDSEKAGIDALGTFDVGPKDVVVLISGSASAKFNIGAGTLASNQGASVFYFYNTEQISSYAEEFMHKHKVKRLLLDVGSQAITGSTRLQAASVAKVCLGTSLFHASTLINKTQEQTPSPLTVYQTNRNRIPDYFNDIANLINLELEVFQSPQANFYRTKDETSQGYVTFLCSQNAMKEVMFDCVEMSPTFSINSVCSLSDLDRKASEFRAYQLLSGSSNKETWENLISRPLCETEQEVEDFLIDREALGIGSYASRPKKEGNLLVGVLTGTPSSEELQALSDQLTNSASQGGKTGIIAILSSKASSELLALAGRCDASVVIDQIGEDPSSIAETLILKEVLNLISNSSMVGMDKVYGNTMIDLTPSNKKLINRSMRIVRDIYSRRHADEFVCTEELLYHLVTRVFAYKKLMETQHGIYIPPPIRIVLAMVENKCGIKEAVEILKPASFANKA